MNRVSQSKDRNGFTLIELLVVVAIIIVMSAAVGPAFNSMLTARGIESGSSNAADFLEMARNEAMTRQTYVWVGITGTNSSGNDALEMAAAYSADDSGSAEGTGTNVIPFTKVMQVQNVAIVPWTSLSANTRNAWSGGASSTAYFQDLNLANTGPTVQESGTSNFSFTAGSTKFGGGSGYVLLYTPEGQVLFTAAASGTTPYGNATTSGTAYFYDIALRPANGTTVSTTSSNDAAVIVDAATGATTILHP
jgi:prepilin-type N-terminal cleavage/methylation domain-containing protein